MRVTSIVQLGTYCQAIHGEPCTQLVMGGAAVFCESKQQLAAHTPLMHLPSAHATPHAPQWFGSEFRSTHRHAVLEPQFVRPTHSHGAHEPLVQTGQ
jgi:hypothetical protein